MERNPIGAALFSLFDRQRFEENEQLAALIHETEARYEDHSLSDESLLLVSAAGEAGLPRRVGNDRENEP